MRDWVLGAVVKWVQRMLLCGMLTLSSGCNTLIAQYMYCAGTIGPSGRNMLYVGTRVNLSGIFEEGMSREQTLFAVTDLVPSIIGDTLLLPVTLMETVFSPYPSDR